MKKKESAVRKTSKMQDTLFRWLNMSNNTLPSAWLPIDASAAGVSVFASEKWITPSKHQNPFDRRWVHHEQLTSLQQNLSLQSLNHEKAASVAGAAASVACVRQLQEFSNETWILWLSFCVPLRTPSTAIRNLDSKLLTMIHNVTVQSHLLDIFQAQTKAPTKIKCHSLMPRQQPESPEAFLPLPSGGNKYIPKR